MMDEFIRKICEMDIGTLVVMAGMFWMLKSHVDKKIDKIIGETNSRFDKTDSRFDKIEKDIQELRTSINRMEGAFYNKDCCMLKEGQKEKAE